MKNDKILERIKNLKDLGRSDSEHEAAAALAKARELMEKYGISDAELAMQEIREYTTKVGNYKRPPVFQSILFNAVAELFSCKVYVRPGVNKNRTSYKLDVVFVGNDVNAEIAGYCYEVLSRKVTKARKEYISRPENRRYRKGDRTRIGDSYALGWVRSVREKVKSMVPPQPEVEVTTERGLIKVNPLSQWIEERTNSKQFARSRGHYRDDVSAGERDGRNVDIHRGMSGSRPGAKRLN